MEFESMIAGVRAGDAESANKLVREYEKEIRRAIRIHLQDSSLKRVIDSMDICQSVMANFLVRASAGQFELDSPQKVVGLLVTMARNRLVDKKRQYHGRQRHPGGEQKNDSQMLANLPEAGPSPSRMMQGKELLDQIKRHMSPEEAELAELRALGLDWPEIGARLNAKPDSLRKKFTRAVDRIVEQMNVESWLIE
jgi:RNA polymerase sigma-70 factor (ECF subfamily)